jgi:hypothetical protein
VAVLHPLGIRDSPARTLGAALALAFIFHLPLTPFPFIMRWVSAWLSRSDTSWDYKDDSVIIPISLVDDPTPSQPPAPVLPPAAPATAEPKPIPRTHEERVRDAGVADAGEPDAARVVAKADAGKKREAGTELAVTDGGEGDAGAGPSVKDTLSLVGGLKHAIKGKPNVSIVLWLSTIREHPLGQLAGGILTCNPQWHDFLGDQIDPLRDLDGVMLAGPRMSETSKVTVMVQSRMDDAKLQRVMGTLAEKPGGSFVDGGGGRAIQFHADRAERIAFTHPRNMVIVTPPEGFEQLREVREPLSLPPGHGQAMSLTMVTPWRPLRGLGAKLPETLSEIRVNASAASDGGVDVQIEFDDQDAASAEAHARDVTDQARAVGGPLLGDIEFVAQGNHLSASTHFSRLTCAIVLGFVRERLCPSAAFDGGRGAN